MRPLSNKSSARALLKLPQEIAQQILEDIPIYRVLAMVVSLEGTDHQNSFKTLLLSLPRQIRRNLFPNEEHLTTTIDIYKLYCEISQSVTKKSRLLEHPKTSPLSINLNVARSQRSDDAPHWEYERAIQQDWLVQQIHLMMQSLDDWLDDDSSLDDRIWMAHNLHAYQQDWRIVKERHFKFATKRRSEIQRLADIFRKYPTYMKKSSDPGDEARGNHMHVVNQLERCAERYRKDLIFKHHVYRFSHLYAYSHLPIVPLDRDLRLFVDTLLRYSYKNSLRSDIERGNHDIPNLSINGEDAFKPLVYPPHIKNEIDCVLRGWDFLYQKVIPGYEYAYKRTSFAPARTTLQWEQPAVQTSDSSTGE